MRAAIVLAGLLAAGSAMAAETKAPAQAPALDCAADSPAGQLICRDAALGAASEKMDAALKALADAAGEAGREPLAAGQRAWMQRRDAACPVSEADLADPKKGKDRTGCLSRQIAERTKALESELAARRAPVADEPVTITDAAPPPRLAPAQAKPAPAKRPTGLPALVGRWAKADPVARTPVDDCRVSYLELSKDSTLSLHDPRIPGFPVEGRVKLDGGDLAQEDVAFASDAGNGPKGTLRLDAAEAARLDRLFLRLEQPLPFGATFVRCR
ncbi:lysozyme inhibitor LprI family protein [Azospirillum sp. sgz302134]